MPTSHSSAGLRGTTLPTIPTAEEWRRSSGMTAGSDRILTTHVGSLPRSQAVTEVLFAREREESRDRARDDAVITAAVAEVVRRQVEIGLDFVSDGEMSKISYATYIARRLSGFDGDTPREPGQDLVEFPGLLRKRAEYEAIVRAGIILQIDAPDLAMGRHTMYRDRSLEAFEILAARHIEVLNHALRNVPAERVRMHVCWGNYEGPHHHDVPMQRLLPIVLKARPQGLLFEAANPRHAHEWSVFKDASIPDDKILIPGMLATTTNYIEHPQLVAERIERFANIVGRERVMAGTDCGFGTFAGFGPVEPDIAYLKLRSLVEGAQLASRRLWT